MEVELGICPSCKQQIEVNPSEEVDFCPLCSKPYSAQEAIKLYAYNEADRIKREENSRKPPEQAVEKFNAILKQDYKLAKQYLDDFVKKEYPKLDVSFYPSEQKLLSHFGADSYRDSSLVKTIEAGLIKLYEANSQIAEMYRKILCAHVNALYWEKHKQRFKGELPLLKLYLANLQSRLRHMVSLIVYLEPMGWIVIDYDREQETIQEALGIWRGLESAIGYCKRFTKDGLDDQYIFEIIEFVRYWSETPEKYSPSSVKSKTCEGGITINYFLSQKNYDGKMRRIQDFITLLQEYFSPQEKRKLEDEARAKKKAEYDKAYENALAFWQEYINLLKAGKAKQAFKLLDTAPDWWGPYRDEIGKFTRSIWRTKYTGDVSLLQAESYAKRVCSHLK